MTFSSQRQLDASSPAQIRPIQWVTLGQVDYPQASVLQERCLRARIQREQLGDVVLALEHPPVFTLGSQGGREHLHVSTDILHQRGIDVVQTGRGGAVTYHGPGQLILYPIVDLHAMGLKAGDFIDRLEALMLKLCESYALSARRDARNRGVWLGHRKLGSLGIRVRKGVTSHGLALNVGTDLTPFSWLDPCGLKGVEMTSLEAELGRSLSMAHLIERARELFSLLFDRRCERCAAEDFYERLPNE